MNHFNSKSWTVDHHNINRAKIDATGCQYKSVAAMNGSDEQCAQCKSATSVSRTPAVIATTLSPPAPIGRVVKAPEQRRQNEGRNNQRSSCAATCERLQSENVRQSMRVRQISRGSRFACCKRLFSNCTPSLSTEITLTLHELDVVPPCSPLPPFYK